jgi:hypothetical protein
MENEAWRIAQRGKSREEGRGKREEGRGKREEGRGKREAVGRPLSPSYYN